MEGSDLEETWRGNGGWDVICERMSERERQRDKERQRKKIYVKL